MRKRSQKMDKTLLWAGKRTKCAPSSCDYSCWVCVRVRGSINCECFIWKTRWKTKTYNIQTKHLLWKFFLLCPELFTNKLSVESPRQRVNTQHEWFTRMCHSVVISLMCNLWSKTLFQIKKKDKNVQIYKIVKQT